MFAFCDISYCKPNYSSVAATWALFAVLLRAVFAQIISTQFSALLAANPGDATGRRSLSVRHSKAQSPLV